VNFSRFEINLVCRHPFFDDIAIHVNPRFNPPVVVRNTFKSLAWGSEEDNGSFPFAPNTRFEMKITLRNQGFVLIVDGKYFAQYLHRIPIERINGLNIKGDVKITKFEFGHEPSLYPSNPCYPNSTQVNCYYPNSRHVRHRERDSSFIGFVDELIDDFSTIFFD